jgi:ABC-type nitrate/sulfonate/bicarbonate transport system permease component
MIKMLFSNEFTMAEVIVAVWGIKYVAEHDYGLMNCSIYIAAVVVTVIVGMIMRKAFLKNQ